MQQQQQQKYQTRVVCCDIAHKHSKKWQRNIKNVFIYYIKQKPESLTVHKYYGKWFWNVYIYQKKME